MLISNLKKLFLIYKLFGDKIKVTRGDRSKDGLVLKVHYFIKITATLVGAVTFLCFYVFRIFLLIL